MWLHIYAAEWLHVKPASGFSAEPSPWQLAGQVLEHGDVGRVGEVGQAIVPPRRPGGEPRDHAARRVVDEQLLAVDAVAAVDPGGGVPDPPAVVVEGVRAPGEGVVVEDRDQL